MTTFYNTFNDTETQVAPGESSPHSEERSVTVRAGSGVVSYQGGEASSVDTYAAVNSADLIASHPLQARTPSGSPRQGTLQPTDVISIAGTETTVQNAEALGLIERDAQGRYIAVPEGARALQEQPQETYEDAGEALPDASVEANLADLAASITPGTQVAIAMQLINDGVVNQNTLARAAGEGSLEPGDLNERLSTVIGGFQAQADKTLKSLGADDPQGFYEWARENHPQALRKAMNDHIMERTTKGYAPLYQTYVETLDAHSPEDILAAELGGGIKARMEGKTVLLDIPGHGVMSYRSAIKAGLIRVSGV